jgi:hypothetical protein
MQNLIISPEIEQKLTRKHGLKRTDIEQCFRNRLRSYLIDTRLEHLTDPLTEWFISENDRGDLIKVVCIFENGLIFLKSAFIPNEIEISIYNTMSVPC